MDVIALLVIDTPYMNARTNADYIVCDTPFPDTLVQKIL
jgi:hypothetical protein